MRAPVSCAIVVSAILRSAGAAESVVVSAELKPTVALPETTLELVLRNNSKMPQVYPISSAIHARRLGVGGVPGQEDYWAPLDLATGTTYGPNVYPQLRLEPGEHLSIALKLASLKWARAISSVWPSQDLASVLPAGDYDVWYEHDIVVLSSDHRITSRPVRLTVR